MKNRYKIDLSRFNIRMGKFLDSIGFEYRNEEFVNWLSIYKKVLIDYTAEVYRYDSGGPQNMN